MWFLACSGSGAQATIAGNETLALGLGLIAGVLTLTSWRIGQHRTGSRLRYLCLLIFAIHPAWTIRARSGDCGNSKVQAAILVTMLIFVLVAIQTTRFLINRRSSKPHLDIDELA